jgi:hypothetical protein
MGLESRTGYPNSGIQKKCFQDPRSESRDQKALDPGSGSATLFERKNQFFLIRD